MEEVAHVQKSVSSQCRRLLLSLVQRSINQSSLIDQKNMLLQFFYKLKHNFPNCG